jgi:hypothetical protein
MQRERKRDVPGWLWGVGIGTVLIAIAAILAILGWSLDRVGRLAGADQVAPPRIEGSDVRASRTRTPTRA